MTTMIIQSRLRVGAKVSFPSFTGERVYMVPFLQKEGLPKELERWQVTVDAMLEGVESTLPIYIMIDQGALKAGSMQRRGGLHIDGNWIAGSKRHGDIHSIGAGRHGDIHSIGINAGKHTHVNGSSYYPELLILASNVSASRAILGDFVGNVKDDGDCSEIDFHGGESVRLQANLAYCGNVMLVHETLPVTADVERTLVRLNVPGVDLDIAA